MVLDIHITQIQYAPSIINILVCILINIRIAFILRLDGGGVAFFTLTLQIVLLYFINALSKLLKGEVIIKRRSDWRFFMG